MSAKFTLYNKNVIVTGASAGLGKEIVLQLIKKYNCNVLGIARDKTKMNLLTDELGEFSHKFSYQLFDVADKENWQSFADKINSSNFDADVIINNAGILPQFTRFDKYSIEDIHKAQNINFESVLYSMGTFLPIFLRKSGTAIINISSSDALCPLAGTSIYSAGKSAVKSISEAMREEYRENIYIPTVCPGFIRTNIMQNQKHNNQNIINWVSMPAPKAAKRILRKVNARRGRIVIGADAHFMDIFYRIAPVTSQRFLNFIFKFSKLDLFSETYKW